MAFEFISHQHGQFGQCFTAIPKKDPRLHSDELEPHLVKGEFFFAAGGGHECNARRLFGKAMKMKGGPEGNVGWRDHVAANIKGIGQHLFRRQPKQQELALFDALHQPGLFHTIQQAERLEFIQLEQGRYGPAVEREQFVLNENLGRRNRRNMLSHFVN